MRDQQEQMMPSVLKAVPPPTAYLLQRPQRGRQPTLPEIFPATPVYAEVHHGQPVYVYPDPHYNTNPQAMAPPPPPKPKKIRYPIEDLALDPQTDWEQTTLRAPHKELPVPAELFDKFLTCWSFVNTFG